LMEKTERGADYESTIKKASGIATSFI